MKISRLLIAITLIFNILSFNHSVSAQQNVVFADHFRDSTLRVDYLRSGCMKHDTCTLHGFVFQNDSWAGSLTQLIDPINNGEYRIVVSDPTTGQMLYSRCYNTLFEEYRSTIASRLRDSVATFEETMLVPFPKHKVDICLQKRDKQNRFFTSAKFSFDPNNCRNMRRLPAKKPLELLHNGNSHNKIDIVIVA